jgi:hypothetical protein
MTVTICGWCFASRWRTRFHQWLGIEVSHGICARHSREFMRGAR